ncbi:MAG: hypothetical protein ACTHNQ_20705 [Microbacterium sp.]|uniref:hypothetical protein n=1 Tax=Microbacterium sp. TaxID=51671 RepID=UPI003F80FB33
MPIPVDLVEARLARAAMPEGIVQPLWRTVDLRAEGLGRRAIARAVTAGLLLPVRKGTYLRAGVSDEVVSASEAGGLVTCLSALTALGVFVLSDRRMHIHFARSARKHAHARRNAVWHWTPLLRAPHPRATTVHIVDALAQATNCQAPRAAVASLDSALHLGLIDEDDLEEIFSRVQPRKRLLRGFVDGRSESGPETILRMIALMLGFSVDVQVVIRGVGRVDLVLDGWLVVECDSEAFHSGWESQKRDRRRDGPLAARGLVSYRPIAADIMYNSDAIVAALRGLRDAHERGFPRETCANAG